MNCAGKTCRSSLVDRCAEFEAAHGEKAPTAVREAGERAAEVAAALAAHVPDALRPSARARA